MEKNKKENILLQQATEKFAKSIKFPNNKKLHKFIDRTLSQEIGVSVDSYQEKGKFTRPVFADGDKLDSSLSKNKLPKHLIAMVGGSNFCDILSEQAGKVLSQIDDKTTSQILARFFESQRDVENSPEKVSESAGLHDLILPPLSTARFQFIYPTEEEIRAEMNSAIQKRFSGLEAERNFNGRLDNALNITKSIQQPRQDVASDCEVVVDNLVCNEKNDLPIGDQSSLTMSQLMEITEEEFAILAGQHESPFLEKSQSFSKEENARSSTHFDLIDKNSLKYHTAIRFDDETDIGRCSKPAGFSFASGKTISVSTDAIHKAKLLMENMENDTLSIAENDPAKRLKCTVSSLTNDKGSIHETANYNDLRKDKSTIPYSSGLIKGGDSEFKIARTSFDTNYRVTDSENVGIKAAFSSAAGKSITISDQCLSKARQLVADCINFDDASKSVKSPDNEASGKLSIAQSSSSRFSFASGKTIDVSGAALAKARRLAAEVFGDDPNAVESSSGRINKFGNEDNRRGLSDDKTSFHKNKTIVETSTSSVKHSGFTCASGKNVFISDEAMLKAKRIANEVNDEDPEIKSSFDQSSSYLGSRASKEFGFGGFSSASGKNIQVSEESILNAKRIAIEVEDSESNCREISTKDSNINTSKACSFSSANGKSIRVSKESLFKATKRLSELEPNSPAELFKSSLTSTETETTTISTKTYQPQNLGSAVENLVGNKKVTFTNLIRPDTDDPIKSNSIPTGFPSVVVENSSEPGMIEDESAEIWETHVAKERVLLARLEARMELENRIRNKSRTSVKPIPGCFLRQRQSKSSLSSLCSYLQLFSTNRSVSVDDNCYRLPQLFNCKTAGETVFLVKEDVLRLDDELVLVPNDMDEVGIKEVISGFLAMPGVCPKLVSSDWLTHHFSMIVWKLFCLYAVYKQALSFEWLTLKHVMMQLKYRYDKEIDLANRSALKKILEGDDIPSKRMVLFISHIDKKSDNQYNIEVSDGWYTIRCQVDPLLHRLVNSKKITVGTKFITCGAQLNGLPQPASPLSVAAESAYLRLHGNSTRRCSWSAKLGYQPNGGPFALSLSSLKNDGGVVQCVIGVVARIYPTQYMETIDDSSGASTRVFRSERAEQTAANAHYRVKQSTLEQLVEAMDSPCKVSYKKSVSVREIKNLCTGEEIDEALSTSNDPEEFQMHLNDKQRHLFQDYRQRKVQDALQERVRERQVTRLLKFKLAGLHLHDMDQKICAMFNLWNPPDNVLNVIKEGAPIKVFNFQIAKNTSGPCFSNCQLQLSGGRATQFKTMSKVAETSIENVYEPRVVYSVPEAFRIFNQFSPKLKHTEIDCVGVVIKLNSSPTPVADASNQSEVPPSVPDDYIFLTQPDASDELVVAVKIWGGIKHLCLSNLLYDGNLVTLTDIQIRSQSVKHHSAPLLHYTDSSDVISHRKQVRLDPLYRTRLISRYSLQSNLPGQSTPISQRQNLPSSSKSVEDQRQRTTSKLQKLNQYCGIAKDKELDLRVDSPSILPSKCSTPRTGLTKRPGMSRMKMTHTPKVVKFDMSAADKSCSDAADLSNSFASEDYQNESIADLVKTRRRRSSVTHSSQSPSSVLSQILRCNSDSQESPSVPKRKRTL